ncbi:cytoplasmic tRNA 2-thiolation protein 2 isoform X2 [Hyperolius riggenbachi]|uniref:cytoplasmic tRNA 2-thiolation protein 2 isoform X2 n=1 Tax=Hyperolius riggenbachi TaxID=752182 RepID=UPI0035A3942B
MCDVEESSCQDIRKEEGGARIGQTCMKCKEATAVLIIRVGDAFCRTCFREYFVHKFRAMLGKNRVVYPGEKVLLAYSGGPSSSAMIQQVQEGLSRDAPKKLRFTPGVLFIDEGAVCGQSWQDRERVITEIQSILKATSFPFHIIPLEQLFSLPRSVLEKNLSMSPTQSGNYKQAVGTFLDQQRAHDVDGITEATNRLAEMHTADTIPSECSNSLPYNRPAPDHTAALMSMFHSAKTLTAKQQLLHSLRNHLMVHVARKYGYTKVMTGESCTRLAVNLLANISLGRGAFLPLDTGFSDDRHGDVVVVRPMRDYSLKEISFYNRLFNVQSVFIPTLDTKACGNSGIQHLSETFITKLQADFPSTVSTVYRTSEKLHVSRTEVSQDQSKQERCLLCMCPSDTSTGAASAFSATQVSQQLSQRRPPNSVTSAENSGKQCCNGEQCCEDVASCTQPSVTGPEDIVHLLCYSCRVTIKDLSVDTLPSYLMKEAEHRNRRVQMRKEIEEFLLDDNPGDL